MVVIVMGVSGVGKTTIGRRVAAVLDATFLDADDFHTTAAMVRMLEGHAIGERERGPWIRRVRLAVAPFADQGSPTVVLACSALRADNRAQLTNGIAEVRWVHLAGDPALIAERLDLRSGGVGPALLPSQLATLEPPDDAIVVNVEGSVTEVVDEVLLGLAAAP